jgi:hypothetical protein
MESQSIAIGINCSLVGDRPNRPYQFEKGVPFNLVTSCGIPVQAEFIIKPRRLGSHSSPRFGKFRPFLGENTTLVPGGRPTSSTCDRGKIPHPDAVNRRRSAPS